MEQLSIFSAPPVNGTTRASIAASRSGARAIVKCWTARQSAYLQLLRQGPISDQEAASVLGFQLCSINSVRGALSKQFSIVPDGFDVHVCRDGAGKERVTKRTRWALQ